MVNYILDLVKNNNRVIIPNFGAFIISKENGFSVLFNNFLSFNDGLLVNHVAKTKNIDTAQALDEVNLFVDSIKNALDFDGTFDIPGLGKFNKDNKGILRFIQDSDISILEETDMKKKVSGDLLDIVPAEESINTTISSEPEKTTPITSAYAANDTLLNIDNEKEQPEVVTPPKTVTPPKPAAPSKPTTTKKTSPPIQNTNNTTVRKKRSPIPFLIVLLLLIIGGIVYYFGWHNPIDFKKINFSFFNKQKADTTLFVQKPVAPVAIDTIKTAKQEPVAKKETEITSDKKFHIIVATLNSEQLANEKVEALKAKGFEQAMVIPHSDKYLVSIDAADDIVSADARQEEIVNNNRIESYVLTLK